MWNHISGDSDGKESACNVGDLGLIPGLGGLPGQGNGNPFLYSCLGNPMERGAWRAQSMGLKESDMKEWLTLSHELVENICAYLYIRAEVISKHKSNKRNYDQKLISFEYPAVNFSFTWTFEYSERFVYILILYCLNALSSRYQNLTFTLVKWIYQLLLKSPII